MAQYKHDRFFKLYIKSLYDVRKGTIPPVDPIIGVEDYAIDLLFKPDLKSPFWKKQKLGLLDLILKSNPVEIVEHYSVDFRKDDLLVCSFRRFGYELQRGEKPFTWVLTNHLTDWIHESLPVAVAPDWRTPYKLDLLPPKTKTRQKIDPRDPRQLEPFLFDNSLNMGIVVLDRLPLTKDTAWLLLLGGEKQCKDAYQTIAEFPNSPQKTATLKICQRFNTYIRSLPVEQQLLEENQTYLNAFKDVDRDLDKTYEEIKAEGKAEGKAQVIQSLSTNESVPQEVRDFLKGLTPDRLNALLDRQAESPSNVVYGSIEPDDGESESDGMAEECP